MDLPEIDITGLREDGPGATAVARSLDAACRTAGFFYVSGHGVDPGLCDHLEKLAHHFFSLEDEEKSKIAMDRGGPAWRGWFPLGGELTSGVPDDKEGLYFGAELADDHPRVRAGTPLHGPNLFPRRPRELQGVVSAYIDAMTRLGQLILSGIALGLGLPRSWFVEHLTADPLVLFRIFRYPARSDRNTAADNRWGVHAHTDYGLLTVLGQDSCGGLEVRTPGGWIDAPPRPGTFVCNLGDMLERLTGGRYVSTLHRVKNSADTDRLSFPFFLDPSWDAVVERLPIVDRPQEDDAALRWDRASVHGYVGRYGDYLVAKVGKVFPDLAADTLRNRSSQ